MSKRARDRQIKEGVRALRQKPGWDPATVVRKSPAEQLRELEQAENTDRSYGEADQCPACQKARAESGDETSLCRSHFAQAMGLPADDGPA